MPKFCVRIIKDVWERADIEVEAANAAAAETAALAMAENDEEIHWRWEATNSYDAVSIEEVKAEAAQ